MNNQREIGPDIIRTLAIICVVCGHFFSVNTPFNTAVYTGVPMLAQGCLKGIFCYLGVPLFLMLTGYFNCRKEFSVQYYKNIKRILIPYVVISFITWIVLSTNHSIKELILGTLGFTLVKYAWYVEMFIGLYLSVPFLNIVAEKVFNSSDKKIIYGLFAVLIFMTSLPPLIDRGEYRFVPNYWQMCFPVLLYFTGAYIRHSQPVIKRKVLAAFFILGVYLFYPIANYLLISIKGGNGIANPFGPYYAVPGYAAMTVLFILLYKVEISSCIWRKAITGISLVSYEMFLFSYLIDRLVYPWIMQRYYTSQSEFTLWFFPITLLVLTISFVLAFAYKKTEGLIKRLCHGDE